MSELKKRQIGARTPQSARRQAVDLDQQSIVSIGRLAAANPLPALIQPAVEGVDLTAWYAGNYDEMNRLLQRDGGILFRGFGLRQVEEFEGFISATVRGPLLEYRYRSTPRSQISGQIYTSTEYPPDQSIPLHNEMSYAHDWPLKIGFMSIIVAASGGATPIADSRKVYARIDPAVRQRFAEQQVMYVRNYGQGIDLRWQEVFQTEERAEVEAFCAEAGIDIEWHDNDRLTTRQVCQAVATHPVTGETVWFNQAHLFHSSSIEPEVRQALIATLGEDSLPRNTRYGDGAPIDDATLDHIRAAFASETIAFAWQEGDILLLDNMLVAHGREPFAGPRKVIVGMAEPFSATLQG